MSDKSIYDMNREELNAYAESIGIEEPTQYKRREELEAAIRDRHAAEAAGDNDGDANGGSDEAAGSAESGDAGAGDTAPTSGVASAVMVPEGNPAWIRVTGQTAENRVSFWEQHALHPNGEVFIRGKQTAEVYPTQGVFQAIKNHRLKRA